MAPPTRRRWLIPLFTAALLITRAFSGRRARSLVATISLWAHDGAPAAYPEMNNATRPPSGQRRQSAGRRRERMSLYAGEGFQAAEHRPAGEIIDAALHRVSGVTTRRQVDRSSSPRRLSNGSPATCTI